jgi:GAF domain-containing protein
MQADIPRINEEIARKFQSVELRLAGCRTAIELFETLLVEIQREFAIPFVWLTLIRLPETAALREELEASELRDRLSVVADEVFREIVPAGAGPLLVNGDLRPFFRLLPPSRKYLIRSLAVSPLLFHGKTIGSLNQGDSSPTRYDPLMDATLLTGLARSVSEGLLPFLARGRAKPHTSHDA